MVTFWMVKLLPFELMVWAPRPARINDWFPLYVPALPRVKLPYTVFAVLENEAVRVKPVKLKSLPSRGISAVYVPAALLTVKFTVSWQSGTLAPPAPLVVVDQVAVDDQLPATTA